MGVFNSILVPQCDINKLKYYIHSDDLASLKKVIKFINSRDLLELLLLSIYKERKEIFDVILEKVEVVMKSDAFYYEQCFFASVNCSVPYYALRLIHIIRSILPTEQNILLHIAVHFKNEVVAHQLILNGVDINAFLPCHWVLHGPDFYALNSITGTTVLEEAIRCNNLELVCMLLYHGVCVNDPHNNLTSFMFSVIFKSSEEIQRVLIDYESDFNLCWNGLSTLFLAIKYDSPLTLEIIKRGADVNYYNGVHNVISLAMSCNCNPNIFQTLWDQFDYEVWKLSFSKSVFMKFLETDIATPAMWLDYLNIFMDNEAKLQLDIEHHNNSYFLQSDLLVTNFFFNCLENGVQEGIMEPWITHLLSHGAYIFKKDVDTVFLEKKTITPFIDLLLYMDLHDSDENYNSFMYFKYTPVPSLRDFVLNIAMSPNRFYTSLNILRRFYAFSNECQEQLLEILDIEDLRYNDCKQILKTLVIFPSLLQLSRDSARKAICVNYNIKNSCRLHTIVKNLTVPKYVEDILLLNKYIYHFPLH